MKDIKGYEGRYAITEDGRVWSYPNRRNSYRGMWLKPFTAKNGKARWHLFVSLFDLSGTRKTHQVHRLVAEAYIPNPMNKPIVNHIDGNSLNPHMNNLEWVTNKENGDHAFRTGLSRKRLTDGEVRAIRTICKFESCRKVALAYGFHPSSIWEIATHRQYKEVA